MDSTDAARLERISALVQSFVEDAERLNDLQMITAISSATGLVRHILTMEPGDRLQAAKTFTTLESLAIAAADRVGAPDRLNEFRAALYDVRRTLGIAN